MDKSHFNTIEDVRKSGRHLSLEERGMIQALHRQGLSLRSIAAEVGCAHTTVFYELRRGTRYTYAKRKPWPCSAVYCEAWSCSLCQKSQELKETL